MHILVVIRLRVVYGGRRVGQVLPSYQNRQISALDETADAPRSSLFPLFTLPPLLSSPSSLFPLLFLSPLLPFPSSSFPLFFLSPLLPSPSSSFLLFFLSPLLPFPSSSFPLFFLSPLLPDLLLPPPLLSHFFLIFLLFFLFFSFCFPPFSPLFLWQHI